MSDKITRQMITESSLSGDFGNLLWLERATELAQEIYPGDGSNTAVARRNAECTIDTILGNTLHGMVATDKDQVVPETLTDDEIEGWLIEQVIRKNLQLEEILRSSPYSGRIYIATQEARTDG